MDRHTQFAQTKNTSRKKKEFFYLSGMGDQKSYRKYFIGIRLEIIEIALEERNISS